MKTKSLKNSLRYFDSDSSDPVSKAKQEMNDLLDEDLMSIKSRYLDLMKKRKGAEDVKSA